MTEVLPKAVPTKPYRVDIHGIDGTLVESTGFAELGEELDVAFDAAVRKAEEMSGRLGEPYSVQVVQVLYQRNVFTLPAKMEIPEEDDIERQRAEFEKIMRMPNPAYQGEMGIFEGYGEGEQPSSGER